MLIHPEIAELRERPTAEPAGSDSSDRTSRRSLDVHFDHLWLVAVVVFRPGEVCEWGGPCPALRSPYVRLEILPFTQFFFPIGCWGP